MVSILGEMAVLCPALGFYLFAAVQWGALLSLLGLAQPVLIFIVIFPLIYLILTGLVSSFFNPHLGGGIESRDSLVSPWRPFAESALLTLTCLVVPVFPILPLVAGIYWLVAALIRGPSKAWSDVKGGYQAIKKRIRPFFLWPRIYDRFFQKIFQNQHWSIEIEKSNFDYLTSLEESKATEVANFMNDARNKSALVCLLKREKAFENFFNQPVAGWGKQVENFKTKEKALQQLEKVYVMMRRQGRDEMHFFIRCIIPFFDFFYEKEEQEIACIFSDMFDDFLKHQKKQKNEQHSIRFLWNFVCFFQINQITYHDPVKKEKNKTIYSIFFRAAFENIEKIKKDQKHIIQELIEEKRFGSMINFFDQLAPGNPDLLLETKWFEEKDQQAGPVSILDKMILLLKTKWFEEKDQQAGPVSILDKLIDDLKNPEKFFNNVMYIEEWIEARLSMQWPEEAERLPADVSKKLEKICSELNNDEEFDRFRKEIIQEVLLKGIPLGGRRDMFFKTIKSKMNEKFKPALSHQEERSARFAFYAAGDKTYSKYFNSQDFFKSKKLADECRRTFALQPAQFYCSNPDKIPDEKDVEQLSLAERLQVRDAFALIDEALFFNNCKVHVLHKWSRNNIFDKNIVCGQNENKRDESELSNEWAESIAACLEGAQWPDLDWIDALYPFLSDEVKREAVLEARIKWWVRAIDRQPQIGVFKKDFLQRLKKRTPEEAKADAPEEKSAILSEELLNRHAALKSADQEELQNFHEQVALTIAVSKHAKKLEFGSVPHSACCRKISGLLEAMGKQVKASRMHGPQNERDGYVQACCKWVSEELESCAENESSIFGKNNLRVTEKTFNQFKADTCWMPIGTSPQVTMYEQWMYEQSTPVEKNPCRISHIPPIPRCP